MIAIPGMPIAQTSMPCVFDEGLDVLFRRRFGRQLAEDDFKVPFIRIKQVAEQVVRRRDALALVPFLETDGKVDELEVVVDDGRGGLFDGPYLADSQECAVVNLRGPFQTDIFLRILV